MVTLMPAASQSPPRARSGDDPAWLLALATSTELCALALSSSRHKEPWVAQATSGASASEVVLGLIDSLLRQAGTSRAGLSAIVFDCGPGAFTGVRLGCAVAQGLAFALDRPVIPVSSLEAAVTHGFAQLHPGTVAWAAIDARMGEVYCAPFVANAEGVPQPLAPPRVLPAHAAVAWMAAVETDTPGLPGLAPVRPRPSQVLVGNGFERFAELADWGHEQGCPMAPGAWPSAPAVLSCGDRHWRAGHGVPAGLAEPLYVRDKVALDLSEQRPRR